MHPPKTEKTKIDLKRRIKEKIPRDLGPEDSSVHTRSKGPTVQPCVDSNVECKWINGEFSQVTKYKETIGKIEKTLHLW